MLTEHAGTGSRCIGRTSEERRIEETPVPAGSQPVPDNSPPRFYPVQFHPEFGYLAPTLRFRSKLSLMGKGAAFGLVARPDFRPGMVAGIRPGEIDRIAQPFESRAIVAVIQHEEGRMPEVYVHVVKGRSAEQKKALAQDITTAVMKHMNAPADAVVVSIIETEAENKAKGGVMFSERRR